MQQLDSLSSCLNAFPQPKHRGSNLCLKFAEIKIHWIARSYTEGSLHCQVIIYVWAAQAKWAMTWHKSNDVNWMCGNILSDECSISDS